MQAIDDYINSVRYLPPAPRVVPELLKLLNQPDVDSDKVVKIIAVDPSLTANILRVCNSAYFAAATPIVDLQEAVTRIGFQEIYKLVTAATGSKLLTPPPTGYGLDPGELWRHSVSAAVAARLVAQRLGDDDSLVFTAALLHDLGKIVLGQAVDESYAKLIRDAELNQLSLIESETKLLGVNHAEVGGRLLTRWKFPAPIIAAVEHHHNPAAAGEFKRLAANVYVGNMIAYFMGHGFGHLAFALRGRTEVLAILDIAPETIPQFMAETFDQMHVIESLFTLADPAPKS